MAAFINALAIIFPVSGFIPYLINSCSNEFCFLISISALKLSQAAQFSHDVAFSANGVRCKGTKSPGWGTKSHIRKDNKPSVSIHAQA